MATTIDNLVLQYVTRGESSFRSSLSTNGSAIAAFESRLDKLNLAQNIIAGAGGYKMIQFVKNLGVASLESSGNMQKNQAAFEQLLGSADAGNKKIAELQQFAAKTPFSMTQLVASSKQLMAMGFTANELIPTMTSLGNAMSALGGNDEMFDRVIYNLGQIRAQGKAYAMDLRQFAMAGINVAEVMEKATGKHFSNSQLTEMDGEQFIADFMKGLNMKFGGMLDKMTKTLPGKLNNLGDQFEQLKIKLGDVIAPDAMKGIDILTSGVKELESIAENHPGLLKTILYGGGAIVGGAGTLLVGGALAGAYKNITDILGKTTKAKQLLTDATKLDTAAEAAKAVVAGKEGKAIGTVGEIVEGVADSKGRLALETEKAAAKMGLLAKVKNLLGKELIKPSGEVPLGPVLNNMRDPITGRIMGGFKAAQLESRAAARVAGLAPMEGFGSGLTVGGAAMGAGLGIGAGVSAYNNWKMAGDTTGEAAAKAAVTGIGAGLVSMFVPGGAIAVAAGEAIGAGINQFVNKPMERAAVSDNPLSDTPETQGMTAQQKAEYYKKKAADDMAAAKATPWLFSGRAQGLFDQSKEEERQSQLFAQQSRWEKARAKKKADADAQAAADAKRAADDRSNAIYNTINNGAAFYGSASQSRNGAWTITIPQTPADKSHRKIKANNNMTPNFL